MFWKVYFGVICVLIVLGLATEGLGGSWGAADLIVTSGGVAGLFLYAFKKRLFSALVWKIYLPVLIIWDVVYNLVIKPANTGQPADMNALAGWAFAIPIYVAVYLYGFKFMTEPAPPEIMSTAARGARTAQPGKWLYGLALFFFVAGVLDFVALLSQKGMGVVEGLSEPVAFLGLAAWWAVAGGIAAITFLRRKSGLPSVAVQSAAPKQGSQPGGGDRRREAGRERPYKALRSLAKLYTILAPLVLIGMAFVSLGNFARQAPVAEKVGSSVQLLINGGFYYLLMQSLAQAIYLLFDISGDIRKLNESSDQDRAEKASAPAVP